ncbi:MAG: Maf family protein [Sphaerochaeta sp.]|uniref:Maf family protein n=1 Tax=Sphaerochaeta sp. TaxID=1972642 RepID=UPI002FCB5F14
MADIAAILPKVVLASQSIARKALLEREGVEVIVRPTNCDESHALLDPAKTVAMLAYRKLMAYRSVHGHYELPVLCCDTLISFESALIGKPRDRLHAYAQLASFSGKTQEVHSGWALWFDDKVYSSADKALVVFKPLGKFVIESYLDTGEWEGAAGSYRIQGEGRNLVDHIEGDEATVVGLPLRQLLEKLAQT